MTTTLEAPVTRNSINVHGAMEGDILVATWGYDQTNWDYYEVIHVTSKTVTLFDLRHHTLLKGKRTQPGYYTNIPGRYGVRTNTFSNAYFNPDDPQGTHAREDEKRYWSINMGH